jgi:hypothetical protein
MKAHAALFIVVFILSSMISDSVREDTRNDNPHKQAIHRRGRIVIDYTLLPSEQRVYLTADNQYQIPLAREP